MKKLFAPVAVAAFLFAGAAIADEASGTIEAVDPVSRTITLDDGSSFNVSEEVMIEALQPGTEVMVSFEEDANGQMVAREVIPAQ